MSYFEIVCYSTIYLLLLFFIAYLSEKNRKVSQWFKNSAWVYALSLGIYCTAWTFFGSIGRASTTGLGYIGVYLGPTLLAPLWLYFLKKIIRISKYLRITSVADFVSSRYGKSTRLGVLVSLVCVLIVFPYISIQLKALQFCVSLLHEGISGGNNIVVNPHFYLDPAFLFGLAFTLFAIIFGTAKLDPSEKHPGIVNVMAAASIIKLICFILAALVIVYGVFNGLADIFKQASEKLEMRTLAKIGEEGQSYNSWFWILILSSFAFLFLPRQFHMAVVENNSVNHLKRASWVMPLYLFLISLFVIPIALGGKLLLGDSVEADTYLLSIPLSQEIPILPMVVFIGGLSAISGMIIVSVISVSIMISNNIFLPLMLKVKKQFKYFLDDLNTRILQLRKVIIVLVMLMSYAFYRGFTINYSLVSVGLITFAGIGQLAPMILLGLYWKYSNEKGAIIGFLAGVLIWAYTLPIANLAELGVIDKSFLEQGLLQISWLRPRALFGVEGMSHIAHGSFWSLFINTFLLVGISLSTRRSSVEIAQSDIFINPGKYYKSTRPKTHVLIREANYGELKKTLTIILGPNKSKNILSNYFNKRNIQKEPESADSELIAYIEKFLAGSIGTASANIVLNHIVNQEPVDNNEILSILDQTFQVYEYSLKLEKKSAELAKKSVELEQANEKLKQLDQLKNEFISNVTHELRTPITSIRSIADMLMRYEVTPEEKEQFLRVIHEESERISSLVNQVLDLRKIKDKPELLIETFDLKDIIEDLILGFENLAEGRSLMIVGDRISIENDKNKLKQVLLNLVSNAIKFTDPKQGEIRISWEKYNEGVQIEIKDNGIGIDIKEKDQIFERFYQASSKKELKTMGSGLGLAIVKSYVEAMGGKIDVKTKKDQGSTFKIIL